MYQNDDRNLYNTMCRCHRYKKHIQNEVGELPGVKLVEADVATKVTTITFEAPASEDVIKDLSAELNYPAA